MAKHRVSVCETQTVVLTRLCWCGAHHRELPRMGCGQEMERKKGKGILERVWLPTGFPLEEGHKGHKILVV